MEARLQPRQGRHNVAQRVGMCEKMMDEEKASRKGAETQSLAKQAKELFLAFLCALASLREVLHFFTRSCAVGHILSALAGLATVMHYCNLK